MENWIVSNSVNIQTILDCVCLDEEIYINTH